MSIADNSMRSTAEVVDLHNHQARKEMNTALGAGAIKKWMEGELGLTMGQRTRGINPLTHNGKRVATYHAGNSKGWRVSFTADHVVPRQDGKRTCTFGKGEEMDLVGMVSRWHELNVDEFILTKNVWAVEPFNAHFTQSAAETKANLATMAGDKKKKPTVVTYTQAITSPLWQARPWLTEINDLSIQRKLNPYAVLMTLLGHVALRVRPNVIISNPSDVSLNVFIMLLGVPGAGKGEITKLCKKLVKYDGSLTGRRDFDPTDYTQAGNKRAELTEETGWSGQGMARSFTWMGKAGERPENWAPPHVLFSESEVTNLIANTKTTASSQIPVMNKVFMGELIGSANADKANRYQAPAHAYRAVVVIEAQPGAVGPLFTEQGGDVTGFTARLLVARPRLATRAEIDDINRKLKAGDIVKNDDPEAVVVIDPQLCKPIPANADGLKAFPTAPDVMDMIETQLEDLFAIDSHNDDPTAGHTVLIRRKVATLLAIASGDPEVTMEHWDMAGYVVDHSRATVSGWRKDNADQSRQRSVAGKVQALQDDDEAENLLYANKVDACINYVMARKSIALTDLKRNGPVSGKWRHMFDSIVEDMIATGKIEKQEVKSNQFRLVAVV